MSEPSLCNACKSLSPEALLSGEESEHKTSYEELCTSAQMCELCALIKSAIPSQGTYEGRVYTPESSKGGVTIRAGLDNVVGPRTLAHLSSLWVACPFLHGELSVHAANPGTLVFASHYSLF
jgi:MinD superfamily P-loop ATPase